MPAVHKCLTSVCFSTDVNVEVVWEFFVVGRCKFNMCIWMLFILNSEGTYVP